MRRWRRRGRILVEEEDVEEAVEEVEEEWNSRANCIARSMPRNVDSRTRRSLTGQILPFYSSFSLVVFSRDL